MVKISTFRPGRRGFPLRRGFEGFSCIMLHENSYLLILKLFLGRLTSTKFHKTCVIKTVFRDLFIFAGFRALRGEEVRLRRPVTFESCQKNIKITSALFMLVTREPFPLSA